MTARKEINVKGGQPEPSFLQNSKHMLVFKAPMIWQFPHLWITHQWRKLAFEPIGSNVTDQQIGPKLTLAYTIHVRFLTPMVWDNRDFCQVNNYGEPISIAKLRRTLEHWRRQDSAAGAFPLALKCFNHDIYIENSAWKAVFQCMFRHLWVYLWTERILSFYWHLFACTGQGLKFRSWLWNVL